MSQTVEGRVAQIIGPVVDVEFPEDHLPEILNAVKITDDGTLGIGKLDAVSYTHLRAHET